MLNAPHPHPHPHPLQVEARNELESYAYSLKNQLADKEKLGGKLSEEETAKIEEVGWSFTSAISTGDYSLHPVYKKQFCLHQILMFIAGY